MISSMISWMIGYLRYPPPSHQVFGALVWTDYDGDDDDDHDQVIMGFTSFTFDLSGGTNEPKK